MEKGLTRPINVDQNKRREKRLAALILPSYWRRYAVKKTNGINQHGYNSNKQRN